MAQSVRSLLLTVSLSLVAPLSMLVDTRSAQAQSTQSLRRASDEYRSAVLVFERHVNRASYFDHYDRRLVDRLEDVSSDFRSAARNPSDLARLLRCWNELLVAHQVVERALIVGCGRADPELIRCWQPVVAALSCLTTEMLRFTGGHRHPHVGNRPNYDDYRYVPGHGQSGFGGDFGYPNNRDFGVQPVDPRFGGSIPVPPRQPSLQPRPSTPPFYGSRGSQVDPRRDTGSVLAEAILNRLLN